MNHCCRALARWLVICAFAGTVAVLALPPQPPSELDQLVADYRAYGLPFPPHDARLVRFPSRGSGHEGDRAVDHLLGFELRATGGKLPPLVLLGTISRVPHDWELSEIVAADPEREDLASVAAEQWASLDITLNAGFATAVQCQARGWRDLARNLLAVSLAEPVVVAGEGTRVGRFYQWPNQPPRKALAEMAWAHWGNELAKSEISLSEILRRMRYVVAVNPQLDMEENRELLFSLEETLKPRRSVPGSIESFIDDLTEPYGGLAEDSYGWHEDPYCRRLVELGFDAMPVLLEHLDDPRLVRRVRGSKGLYIPRTVGEIVHWLLNGLAAEETINLKSQAAAWWERAREIGEENYLLAHKSEGIYRVLAKKYPHHLPGVYRNYLSDPSTYEYESWLLADLVANCSLENHLKVAVLDEAAQHPLFVQRVTALSRLSALDAHRFVQLLLVELDRAPATTAGEYGEESPAARLSQLALETDDPSAWAALERAAIRADVGLRMDYLQPDACCGTGDRQRLRRIEFLVKFLDDETVRDVEANPRQFKGLHAGWGFPKLEVRNLAALELATLLDLNDDAQADWTPDQWAKLRARVQQRLVTRQNQNDR